ncbi:MAG: hypothetical protein R2792_13280 [Saprospiraceae bacterium]
MAQVSWIFTDNSGQTNPVGLYHGDRTGHVIIHINRKIVQIDFSVRKSKHYTFFIQDELIEIFLHKEENGFSYEFKINRSADTPLNRARKVRDRGYMKKIILTVLAAAALVVGVLYVALWYGGEQKKKQWAAWGIESEAEIKQVKNLIRNGLSTEAVFFIKRDSGETAQAFYQYITDNDQTFSGKIKGTEAEWMLPTGFPLQNGDRFQLIYLPSDPVVHRINYGRPDNATIERYESLALQVEQSGHPSQDEDASTCVVQMIVREKGWASLAHVLAQGKNPESSPQFNRDSYLRLIRSSPLKNRLQTACGRLAE